MSYGRDYFRDVKFVILYVEPVKSDFDNVEDEQTFLYNNKVNEKNEKLSLWICVVASSQGSQGDEKMRAPFFFKIFNFSSKKSNIFPKFSPLSPIKSLLHSVRTKLTFFRLVPHSRRIFYNIYPQQENFFLNQSPSMVFEKWKNFRENGKIFEKRN